MKTQIKKILTEYNFDRMTFDEATNALLLLCNSSSQLNEGNETSFDRWIIDNKIQKVLNRYLYKGLELNRLQLYTKYRKAIKDSV